MLAIVSDAGQSVPGSFGKLAGFAKLLDSLADVAIIGCDGAKLSVIVGRELAHGLHRCLLDLLKVKLVQKPKANPALNNAIVGFRKLPVGVPGKRMVGREGFALHAVVGVLGRKLRGAEEDGKLLHG